MVMWVNRCLPYISLICALFLFVLDAKIWLEGSKAIGCFKLGNLLSTLATMNVPPFPLAFTLRTPMPNCMRSSVECLVKALKMRWVKAAVVYSCMALRNLLGLKSIVGLISRDAGKHLHCIVCKPNATLLGL